MERIKILPNKENQTPIHAFLLHLKQEKRSQKTMIESTRRLITFFKEKDLPFSSIAPMDIYQWMERQQKDWKPNTLQNALCTLRSFYHFCVSEGFINQSPVPHKKKREGTVEKYWEIGKSLPNEDNQKVINEFLLHQKNMNFTKHTVSIYRKRLQFFFKDTDTPFSSITLNDLEEWLIKHQQNWKKGTINKYVYLLDSFYDFCVDQGYLETSPMDNVWRAKEGKKKEWEIQIPLPNRENQNVLHEFLLSLKVMNYSMVTVNNYRYSLQTFFKEQTALFSTLSSEEILDWLHIYAKGKKEKTVMNKINALMGFYHFCVEEGHIEKCPIKSRWYPLLPKPVPKYLGREDVAKIRQQAEKEPLRNRVLLEFLLTSGCRVGETHRLNRGDVDLESRTAIVIGKGKKIRQVHFTERCSLLLERYLETRKDQKTALFISSQGKRPRMSIVSMQTTVRRIGKEANLSRSLHPHRLRHTFATDLLAKGADLSFIADELGHSDLNTTQVYTHVQNSTIIAMYQKYMG